MGSSPKRTVPRNDARQAQRRGEDHGRAAMARVLGVPHERLPAAIVRREAGGLY